MRDANDQYAVTPEEVLIAVGEYLPEANYGSVPVIDQFDAVEAYRAYDDGGLAEAPSAFAAYLVSLQNNSH